MSHLQNKRLMKIVQIFFFLYYFWGCFCQKYSVSTHLYCTCVEEINYESVGVIAVSCKLK